MLAILNIHVYLFSFPRHATQHSERITGVCIDRYGDFVATCSDDGKVSATDVIFLCTV